MRPPTSPNPKGMPSPSGRPARLASGSGLPLPPSMATSASSKSYGQAISSSLTIEEMRDLHHRALQEAEAKRTELRLVLASRYRELVGSSDEVLKMRERSQELHELVHALPGLLTTLVQENDGMIDQVKSMANTISSSNEKQEESKEAPPASEQDALIQLRRQVSTLPRVVHRSLDQHNLHGAALNLIQLFTLLAQQTDAFPMATALAKPNSYNITAPKFTDAALQAQMKMTFLHVQTIPDKIGRLALQMLEGAASYGPLLVVEKSATALDTKKSQPPIFGAQWSAAALAALDLLDRTSATPSQRASKLLDLYYDSKATLLQSLLDQLHTSASTTTTAAETDTHSSTAAPDNAEEILSKILLILQYDIILHPYQLFVLRNFPVGSGSGQVPNNKTPTATDILASLPTFDATQARAKCSNFLAQHLPLLRTKVKSILISIAGTTASALGQMRQSLYDKTDGADCMGLLKDVETNLCSWEDALSSLVDIQTIAAGGGMPIMPPAGDDGPKFSLWSALFSNTFSSLVHNILTTSFQSVHTKVVSTLRTSLASAPPLEAMLPHEAYRNTLKIATDLDQALWNVRKDAHELLVHAEEREESERRLRLSLYVQTCEIMGRLVCELRRMILLTTSSSNEASAEKTRADAVQELIVGRLCYLLKFRLTSLPTLLDPQSAPSSAASGAAASAGMINRFELQSAFELADDNDDGLITFTEAMEAAESAFSGTPFHGAEMVRETLLLGAEYDDQAPSSSADLMMAGSKDSMESVDGIPKAPSSSGDTPANVTLSELALLTARGLKHDTTGINSALGTVQQALDDIVENCFLEWAKASLRPSVDKLSARVTDFYKVSSTTTDEEWNRLFNPAASPGAGGALEKVSPSTVGYVLDVSSVLNRTIFPTDSLLPVPSMEYAASLGIVVDKIPTMKDTIRWSLVRQSAALVVNTYQAANAEQEYRLKEKDQNGKPKYNSPPVSPLLQLKADLTFVKTCYFERLQRDLAATFQERQSREDILGKSKETLEELIATVEQQLRPFPNAATLARSIPEKHQQVLEASDLFLSSLLGRASEATVSSMATPPDLGGSTSNATPWINNPLPSSRRFNLLPVQSDRGLTEMQLRKYGKKNAQEDESGQSGPSSGMQGLQKGLGFLFGRS